MFSIFRLFIFIPIFFSSFAINAQSNSVEEKLKIHMPYCLTDELNNEKIRNNPLYKEKTERINHESHLSSIHKGRSRMAAGNYTIPVVVHIIHNNGTENISDQQVIAGIEHLNKAFARLPPFNGINSADVGIQFCLAKQDPNGNFTSGINRVVSSLTELNSTTQDISLKNLSRWDPENYLNIWLVKEICSDGNDCGVAGYAYFAAAHGQPFDGIVNEARWFGSSEHNSKVHVHEVGHYLNLYHTFEGGCTNHNSLLDGDRISDTPPDQSTSPVYPCSSLVNTCTTDDDDLSANNPFRPVANGGKGDQNDMFENYMDYGHQDCQNTFTEGQKDRMTAALLGPRSSLLDSKGCNNICTIPIVASFNYSPATITAGTPVTFTNNSTGADAYEWKINGNTISTEMHPTYNFNGTGNYTVTLTARNSDAACTEQSSIHINVICTAVASFTASTNSPSPGDNVSFTNTSTGASSYKWMLDGQLVSTSSNYSHSFTKGAYEIYLIASMGACSDTSKRNFISVGECALNTNYIWLFGDKSDLDFSSGSPVSKNITTMQANEGSSSVCDGSGNLLFYCNGIEVYNKDHTIMPNGQGLLGHVSSTQASLIVPHPGNANLYFLFTTDAAENRGVGGLRYNVIDMTLDGGLGDVTSKNVLLFSPNSEKLTATYHSNNKDIWVVSHRFETNNFMAYLINENGINVTPVISSTGTIADSELGGIKISPNGKKLASCYAGTSRSVQLFDFDNSTGVISNPNTLFYSGTAQPYATEFAPDNSKLYFTNVNSGPRVFQYDLGAGSISDIINSQYSFGTSGGGGLSLGPDNKIYLGDFPMSAISVIHNPNEAGTACNYSQASIPVSGWVQWGFVNMFNRNNSITIQIAGKDSVCEFTDSHLYNITPAVNSPSYYTWDLKGRGDIQVKDNNSVELNFNENGIDTLISTINYNGCIYSDSLFIKVLANPVVDLGQDTAFCTSPVLKSLDAGWGFSSYLWEDNSAIQTHAVSDEGFFWVTVTDSYGCMATDSIKISAPPVLAIADAEICEGEIHIFNAGRGHDQYRWQDGKEDTMYTAYLPGKYWITVTNACGIVSDTAQLTVKPLPLITFTGLHNACPSDIPFSLSGTPSGGTFIGPGITLNTFNPQIAGVGVHSVIYTYHHSNGCSGSNVQRVNIIDSCRAPLVIPNLITPNGDGMNDKFEIQGIGDGYTLEIFNRWNKLIYRKQNYDNSWDGENSSDGIYFYNLFNNSKNVFKGWIQISR